MKNAGLKRALHMVITAAMAGASLAEAYWFAKSAKILADSSIPNDEITINGKPLVEKQKDDVEEK